VWQRHLKALSTGGAELLRMCGIGIMHETYGISKQLPKATQLPKAAYARRIWGHAP